MVCFDSDDDMPPLEPNPYFINAEADGGQATDDDMPTLEQHVVFIIMVFMVFMSAIEPHMVSLDSDDDSGCPTDDGMPAIDPSPFITGEADGPLYNYAYVTKYVTKWTTRATWSLESAMPA